jgi:uncharacterized iron-regulated protein
VDAMAAICSEVADGKMKEPFEAQNPQLVESPYSGNSVTDFKNNIIGARNVYMGLNGGKGIKDLVVLKNKSLDLTIQNQLAAAINSFDAITLSYEDAIFSQRIQIQQTMQAVGALSATLEQQLLPFIQQNIKY